MFQTSQQVRFYHWYSNSLTWHSCCWSAKDTCYLWWIHPWNKNKLLHISFCWGILYKIDSWSFCWCFVLVATWYRGRVHNLWPSLPLFHHLKQLLFQFDVGEVAQGQAAPGGDVQDALPRDPVDGREALLQGGQALRWEEAGGTEGMKWNSWSTKTENKNCWHQYFETAAEAARSVLNVHIRAYLSTSSWKRAAIMNREYDSF